MNHIKLFGLQRSGTNLVKALIEANFRDAVCLGLVLGDKHGPADWAQIQAWRPTPAILELFGENDPEIHAAMAAAAANELRFVVVIKNPLAWVISYFRYRKLKDRTYGELTSSLLRSYLGLWEQRNGQWLDFVAGQPSGQALVLRHEDMLNAPRGVMRGVARTFGLERRDGPPVTRFAGRMRRGTDRDHGTALEQTDKPFRRDYYLSGSYLGEYPGELLQMAKAEVEAISARDSRLVPFLAAPGEGSRAQGAA